jgi:uncharacterized protein YggE
MTRGMKISVVLGLASVLISVSACTGPGVALTSVSPSKTAAAIGLPANGAPSQGAPVVAPGIPSGGISSSGPALPSQVSSAANVAIPAPAGNVYYNQPFYNQPQNTGIWVTGDGQVSVAPDVASISLGVQAQALTVAEAQGNAANAMNSVVQALKSRGVAEQDIATISFSITPVMNYQSNTLIGYQVSNLVTAKVRKISDTGSVIDAASVAGGNFIRVNGVSFMVDNPVPYLSQARAKAMADASAKASQLASLSGVKLGAPTYISESSTSYVPYPMVYSAGAAVPAQTPTTSISPGQTQISVTVQVVYAIQ